MLPENSIATKLIAETFNLTNDLSELNDSSIKAYLQKSIIYSTYIQGDTIDKNYNKERYLYDIIIISKLYAIIYRLYSYHYNTLNNDEEKFNTFLNDLSISFTTDSKPDTISRIDNNNIIFNNLFNLADLKLNKQISSYYNIYNIDANIFNNYYKNKYLTYESEIINEIININSYETHVPLYHEMINNKSFNVITLLSEYYKYTNYDDIGTININIFSNDGTINTNILSAKYNIYKSNININDYNTQRYFLYFDAYYTILNFKNYDVNTLLLEINKNMHKYYILLYNALIQYGLINIYNNKQYLPLKIKYLDRTIIDPDIVDKPATYIPNLVSSTLEEIPYKSESINIFKNNVDLIYLLRSESILSRNNRIARLLITIKYQLNNFIIPSVDGIIKAIINVTVQQDHNNKIRDIRILISQIKNTYNSLYVSCNIESCYMGLKGKIRCTNIYTTDILVFKTITFKFEDQNYKAIYNNIADTSINRVNGNPINADINEIISKILKDEFKNRLNSIYDNYIKIKTLFDEHIKYRVDFNNYEKKYIKDKKEYDEYTFYAKIKSKYEQYTYSLIDIDKLSYNLNESIANDNINDIKILQDIINIKDFRNIDNILSSFTIISGKYKNEWKLYNKGVYYYRILLSISIFCFIIILIISTININKNIIIGIFIIKIILILLLILFIYKKPNIEKFTSSSADVEDIYYNNYYKLYIETINNYKTIKINNSDKSQYLFNNLVKTFNISKKNYANYANEYSNKIEYYKTKTIDLNEAIQVLKITNMQNYYIILLIYVSFIFILIGLILYFTYPNSLYKIVISVVIFYLLTLMILFIQIHKITSMDNDKNYWSNLNPSLDDLD